MGLGKRLIRELKEALPIGTIIKVLRRNGNAVHSYINDSGFEIGIHTPNEIMFYSPHTMRHHGEIMFDHFEKCSISKTHIKLDSCVIAIKRKAVVQE